MGARKRTLSDLERDLAAQKRLGARGSGMRTSSSSRATSEDTNLVLGRRRLRPPQRSTQNGSLAALESELHGSSKRRGQVRSRSFDAGEPIALAYDRGYYFDEAQAQEPRAFQASFLPDLALDRATWSGEGFEETPALPPCEPRQSVAAPGIVAAPEAFPAAEPPPLALQADVEAFESDLNAIRLRPPQSTRSGPPARISPAAPEDIPVARQASVPPLTKEDPHALFERMRTGLAYATTFDLGPVELAERFDEFNSTLDMEERGSRARPRESSSGPMRLADHELAEDFALMEQKMSAGRTADAAPANVDKPDARLALEPSNAPSCVDPAPVSTFRERPTTLEPAEAGTERLAQTLLQPSALPAEKLAQSLTSHNLP